MLSTISKLAPLILLAGCVAYEPATVVDGVISNPKVGWNGYSIRIPEGMRMLGASTNEEMPDRESEIRQWYKEQVNRYTADYYTSYSEEFFFESPKQEFVLAFISETYELPSGWGVLTSVQTQYLLQKMINRKMVVINDMKAHSEQVEINGRRGWYVSGTARPYFKKEERVFSYEGIFLTGSLKEAFWIEAFGSEEVRPSMKQRIFEMAESLEVK